MGSLESESPAPPGALDLAWTLTPTLSKAEFRLVHIFVPFSRRTLRKLFANTINNNNNNNNNNNECRIYVRRSSQTPKHLEQANYFPN